MKILLVEDNPGDVRLIHIALAEVEAGNFVIVDATTVAEAKQRLEGEAFDLILSDLSLPDSTGLDTVQCILTVAPDVPIIVLTGTNDEALAVKAMQTGAQDYLVKGQVDGPLLRRAMRYAIERHRMQASLRSLSLIDALTGLYNRRGFYTLAEQQLKFAVRAKSNMLLLFADLDCLKEINDTYGHLAGDQALARTAEILRAVVRESDITARIGGDEFVILALETDPDSAERLPERLANSFAANNRETGVPYQISLSVGTALFDQSQPCVLQELMATADAQMYEEKRLKKSRGSHEDTTPMLEG